MSGFALKSPPEKKKSMLLGWFSKQELSAVCFIFKVLPLGDFSVRDHLWKLMMILFP